MDHRRRRGTGPGFASFGVPFPNAETVTVSWGGAPRAQNVAAYTDARGAWHTASGGSFVAGDGVMEPDVYAVLPADWLVRGALKSSRSTPFDPTNGEARDDPATNDAIASWPDYQEAERALKNNFYSVINRDDPSLRPAVQALYQTYDLGVNFWIRPTGPASGLPAYRVSPWRKWGWEHRTSDGIAFAQRVGAGDPGGGADVLFADDYE